MPVADIIQYLTCCLGKKPYQVVNSGVVEQIELSALCSINRVLSPGACTKQQISKWGSIVACFLYKEASAFTCG